MYRPDFAVYRRKSRFWRRLGLLGALAIGVLVVGSMLGWWPFTTTERNSHASTAANSGQTEPDAGFLQPASSFATPVATRLPGVAPLAVAPLFRLPDLFDEQLIVTLSDYAGHPVILNFWASWCVPCREEMPALQLASEEHRDAGLVLLGVNQTYVDDLGAARAFVQELELTFPSVRDDAGVVSQDDYRILGLPTTVFISPEGEIAHVQIGQLTNAQIATFSRKLLLGEPLDE